MNTEEMYLTEEMLPQVKEMIFPCVISKSQLAEYPSCPHRAVPGTDLVACVQVLHDHRSSIGTDDLMHALHMTQKEILDLAVRNQADKDFTLTPLTTMLGNMTGMDMDPPSVQALILSNQEMVMGSGEILNLKAMEEASSLLGPDVVILPSSKHEVLLVSAKDADIPVLEEMVRSVNESVVADSDKLSDSIYTYDALTHRFSMPSMEESITEGAAQSLSVEGGLKL